MTRAARARILIAAGGLVLLPIVIEAQLTTNSARPEHWVSAAAGTDLVGSPPVLENLSSAPNTVEVDLTASTTRLSLSTGPLHRPLRRPSRQMDVPLSHPGS